MQIKKSMSIDTDRGKTNYPEKNLSYCHFSTIIFNWNGVGSNPVFCQAGN
jgi:hypothetical protein